MLRERVKERVKEIIAPKPEEVPKPEEPKEVVAPAPPKVPAVEELTATVEELVRLFQPYDLVGEQKVEITTEMKEIDVTQEFKLVLCTLDGCDMYISFDKIDPVRSFKVFDGSTYTMTRKEKAVPNIYAQAVTGSGTLYLSYWR